jgi:hypothetical protein
MIIFLTPSSGTCRCCSSPIWPWSRQLGQAMALGAEGGLVRRIALIVRLARYREGSTREAVADRTFMGAADKDWPRARLSPRLTLRMLAHTGRVRLGRRWTTG